MAPACGRQAKRLASFNEEEAMGIAHGLSPTQFCRFINGEVRGNIRFLHFYAISRLISFPSTLNNDGITYPNFTKKSISSFDFI
jgi:hypothetical protein